MNNSTEFHCLLQIAERCAPHRRWWACILDFSEITAPYQHSIGARGNRGFEQSKRCCDACCSFADLDAVFPLQAVWAIILET
jgi:hypothetical protein